jgi:hypothetical protein
MDFGPVPEDIKTDHLAAKRASAIAYLGENWMHHPSYQFRQRHSFSVAAWQPHSVLRPVQMAAQLAGRV